MAKQKHNSRKSKLSKSIPSASNLMIPLSIEKQKQISGGVGLSYAMWIDLNTGEFGFNNDNVSCSNNSNSDLDFAIAIELP